MMHVRPYFEFYMCMHDLDPILSSLLCINPEVHQRRELETTYIPLDQYDFTPRVLTHLIIEL
ncbi:hypothetical protein Syun_001562 [Stephania yunnanensis]|uniref:Uncharacterized protein n=1 Tax=Stephania yunnanensis TaxID=152371 RepID=A0AAP0LDY6_9MAGN